MRNERLHQILQSNYFAPLCFLIAAFLRFAWVIINNPYPAIDEYVYFQTGINIANGLGYVHEGVPTTIFPVGYPAFLGLIFSLFGVSVQVAKIANVLLSLGTLYFFYRITQRLFSALIVARIALFLLSIFPDQIFYNALLMTEPLFLFLLMLGIFLAASSDFIKFRHIFATSIIFALCCYVKSQIFFIPALCLFWRVIIKQCTKRTAFKQLIIMYSIIFAMTLPWTVRNFQLNKPAFISGNGPANLVIGNNPTATGTFYLLDNKIWQSIGRSSKVKYVLRWVSAYPQDYLVLLLKKMYFLYLIPEADPLIDLERCTLPQSFSIQEADAIVKNIKERIGAEACIPMGFDNCNELFLQSIIWNEQTRKYSIDPELNDQQKSYFIQLLVFSSNVEHKVKVNSFWHLIWLCSRYAVLVLFVLYIFMIFSSKIIKTKSPSPPGTSVLAMLIVFYFTCIYLVFFGSARFSFPIFPFMIMYVAFLLGNSVGTKESDQ